MKILWQSYTASGNPYLEILQRALQELAGPGVTVDVAGLDHPHSQIHRLSEARCAYQVVAANLDAADRGYDAVVVGHYQDGGVHELRSILDIPVIGLGEASMHHAMMLGDGFGLVTINPGFLSFHRDQVRRYRLESKFIGVRAMDTDPAAYFAAFTGDEAVQRRIAEQFAEKARELVDEGAEVIIPAGGLPALLLFDGGHIPDLAGAVVLDPVALALGQAELWSRLGDRLRVGRRGAFAKADRAVLEDFVVPLAPRNPSSVPTRGGPS